MIEQLTEEERARVELVGTNRERRYARIIDAHAADRAALVKDRDEWQQVSRDWRYRAEQTEAEVRQQKEDRAALVAQSQRDAELAAEWKAQAEAHRHELEVTRDRLTAAEKRAEHNAEAADLWSTRYTDVVALHREAELAATVAEARVAEETLTHDQLLHEVSSYRSGMLAAEARVRELEADVSAAHQDHANAVNAKQQQLAAANALTQSAEARVRDLEAENKRIGDACQLRYEQLAAANALLRMHATQPLHPDVRAHLSALPAAPADHDRAVLEASNAVADGALRWRMAGGVSVDLQDWAQAELARRKALKARESGR